MPRDDPGDGLVLLALDEPERPGRVDPPPVPSTFHDELAVVTVLERGPARRRDRKHGLYVLGLQPPDQLPSRLCRMDATRRDAQVPGPSRLEMPLIAVT